jgi:hypothetical protein
MTFAPNIQTAIGETGISFSEMNSKPLRPRKVYQFYIATQNDPEGLTWVIESEHAVDNLRSADIDQSNMGGSQREI